MTRPRLLDLFCGAGGCAAGYARAGFEVHGVDIKPQPRYLLSGASSFTQADAMEYLAAHGREYDAIHASPPCQAYSVAKNIGNGGSHPDLVAVVRDGLAAARRPWVIENVPGAPLLWPVQVCGLALGLRVKRHRLFESSVLLFGTACPTGHRRDYVTVYGGGAPRVADSRRRASAPVARAAMGIDWMTRGELAQAIPPAYTELVGKQLLRHLEAHP